MSEQCLEIEELQRRHDDFQLHKRIKELSGNFKKVGAEKLIDDQNKLLLTNEEKKEAWTSYVTEVFSDDRSDIVINMEIDDEGPEILVSEVEKVTTANHQDQMIYKLNS